jgi:hypothetical protein
MGRTGPKYAAASIESGTVKIGHTGSDRGVVELRAARFIDRDVVHPQGRECLKLLFVLEGVEATKCTEMITYLYGKDLEELRRALGVPNPDMSEPELSGESVPRS